jgi:hypothetical protein
MEYIEFTAKNIDIGSKETQFHRIQEVYLPLLKAPNELLMSMN